MSERFGTYGLNARNFSTQGTYLRPTLADCSLVLWLISHIGAQQCCDASYGHPRTDMDFKWQHLPQLYCGTEWSSRKLHRHRAKSLCALVRYRHVRHASPRTWTSMVNVSRQGWNVAASKSPVGRFCCRSLFRQAF